jgi:hypothetical protein
MIRSKDLCGPSPFSFGAILLPRREYRTNHARHLAANETVPTLKAKLNRPFSFGLRTAPARFGAEDVGAVQGVLGLTDRPGPGAGQLRRFACSAPFVAGPETSQCSQGSIDSAIPGPTSETMGEALPAGNAGLRGLRRNFVVDTALVEPEGRVAVGHQCHINQ